MLFLSLTVDEYVIKKDHYKGTKVVLEHMVHAPLKGGRSISQTHRHDFPLIVTIGRPEGSTLYMVLLDLNLIVPTHQVYLSKDSRALELVYKVVRSWERVGVWYGLFVKHSVVNTES